MICPNCGKDVPDDLSFCGHCGTKIEEAEKPQDSTEAESVEKTTREPDNEQPVSKAHSTDKLVKASTIMAIIGVAGFLATVIIGKLAYGRVYFFDGYKITGFLCGVEIFLMLSETIGMIVAFIIDKKNNKSIDFKQAGNIKKIVLVLLSVVFSIILISSAVGKSKSSSSGSSGSSNKMDAYVYCMAYVDINDVWVSHDGDYAYVTGTMTNNGGYSVACIKVRAVCKNSSGKIVDTDWTYAIDSNRLYPGESRKFEMMIRDDYRDISTATVTFMMD